jgi:hypothetical protein
MLWQRVRFALLAAVVVAAAALPVWAEDEKKPEPVGAPKDAPKAEPCPLQYRTICVQEMVPEQYQCNVTTYKVVQSEEKYTAYKTVCVEEKRTVTVNKMVAETKTEQRCVTVCVPTEEERTTYKTSYVCRQVTEMKTKCVDKGHYECREVPCGPSMGERLHKLCSRHSCECECEPACPRTKTVKEWVPCPTIVQVPCTRTVRECVQTPVTCKVTVMKPVQKTENVQVTVQKCVPETKEITVQVSKCVPYEATRTVCKCVPTTETVTKTRMVCKTVEKQVPVVEAACECPAPCCEPRHHFRCFR